MACRLGGIGCCQQPWACRTRAITSFLVTFVYAVAIPMIEDHPEVLVLAHSCYLPRTAAAFERRGRLAGYWHADGVVDGVSRERVRTCRMFRNIASLIQAIHRGHAVEKVIWSLWPLWRVWVRRQRFPNYRIVHGQMGFALEGFEAAKGSGALRVIDCPNSHPTTYFGYWKRECDRFYQGRGPAMPLSLLTRMNRELELADLVVCPSVFVRDSMVLNGIPESKCLVNSFGVDLATFSNRRRLPETPVFVFVGILGARKGCPYLFRAFARFREEHPEGRLICVGSIAGEIRAEILRWRHTFEHIPHLSPKDLSDVLCRATAFVLPSQEEGFARVIIEAMACGLPIIASYESGATTLVRDGQEGLIVQGRDPQAICAAMKRLATDPSLNREMGERAAVAAQTNGSWQDYADRLLRRYDQELARRNSDRFS